MKNLMIVNKFYTLKAFLVQIRTIKKQLCAIQKLQTMCQKIAV